MKQQSAPFCIGRIPLPRRLRIPALPALLFAAFAFPDTAPAQSDNVFIDWVSCPTGDCPEEGDSGCCSDAETSGAPGPSTNNTIRSGGGGDSLSSGDDNMEGEPEEENDECVTDDDGESFAADGGDGGNGSVLLSPSQEVRESQLSGGMSATIPAGANRTHRGPGTRRSAPETGQARPAATRRVAYQIRGSSIDDTMYSRQRGVISGVRPGEFHVANDKLEWIKSSSGFLDFLDLPAGSPLGYQIKTYPLDQVTNNVPSGNPVHTVQVRKLANSGTTRRLRILEFGMRNKVTDFYYTPNGLSGKTWEMREGTHSGTLADTATFTALRRIVVTSTVNTSANPDEYTEDHKIYGTHSALNGGTEELLSHKTYRYRKYSFGDRLVETVVDPAGANLVTERFYYETGSSSGLVKQVNLPDGSWRRFDYYSNGRIQKETAPFLGTAAPSPANNPPATGVETVEYAFSGVNRTVTRKIDSQIVGRTWYQKSGSASSGYTWTVTEAHSASATSSDPDNFRTEYTWFGNSQAQPAKNRLKSVVFANGTANVYTYTALSGNGVRVESREGSVSGSYPFTWSATRHWTTDEYNANGLKVRETVKVPVQGQSGGLVLSDREATSLDDLGRPLTWEDLVQAKVRYLDYDCCGIAYERDYNGLLRVYSYDNLGHRSGVKTGYASTFANTSAISKWISDESYAIDALGRRRKVTRHAHGAYATDSLQETTEFNLAGQQIRTIDAAGNSTWYRTEYQTISGKRYTASQISYPSSGSPPLYRTEESKWFNDGRLHSRRVFSSTTTCQSSLAAPSAVTGNLNVLEHMAYAYSALSSGGMEIKEYNTGGTGSLAAWTAETTDMLGRSVSESQSITASTAATTSTTGYYLSADSGQPGYFFGSPRYSENGDSVRSFYRYNSLGEIVEEALDLNGNDILDNTVDRRTLYARAYVDGSAAGLYPAVLRETTTSLVMPDNTTQAVSRTRSSADGDWRETATHPVSGVYATVGTFARTWNATTPGTWTEEEKLPDNTSTIRSYIGGRLSSEMKKDDTSAAVTSTSWTYDGVGRIRTTAEGRTGTTTIASYTAMDLPSQVTDPGSRTTTYTYDNLGNLIEIGFPNLQTQSRTYYAVGPIKRQYGARTYDVLYAYNSYGGRITSMTTKYGSGGAESTATWIYDSYRPELPSGRTFGGPLGSVSYHYSAGGRLIKKETFDTQTFYGYYLSGELRSVDYSSATPDVLFIYDRIGRVVRVEDGTLNGGATAMTSLRYAYNFDWGPQPDLLFSETVEGLHSGGSGIEDKVLTRLRQTTTNAATNQVRFRDKGFTVAGSGGEEYRVEYGFDNAGRLVTVANDGETYTYAYEANSNLVKSMTAGYYKTTRTWESTRDVLASISNTNLTGSSVLSRYTYSVDDIGRRTDIVRDGAAFATAHFDKIGYNAADEVVSSDRFAGTNPAQTGTPITGHEYDWTYDATGNRLTSVINGTTTSYTPAAGTISTPPSPGTRPPMTIAATSCRTPTSRTPGTRKTAW